MSDEARSMWERFINAPENAALLKRYAKSAKEPAPLFESIGEDLGSTNENVRTGAFWALVAATPELTNILHERETREPGWRDGRGKDQQVVNRGTDILSDLHRELVKEHSFNIRDGKDPRPYVNRTIRNRKTDADRKRKNRDGALIEVPLDYEAALQIPDTSGSTEDIVVASRELDDLEKELFTLKCYRSEEERDLFRTIYIDETPLAEALKSYGIPSEQALRQRISRSRKNMVAVRDALFSFLLISESEFAQVGKVPRLPQDPQRSEWWAERAKQSIQPGAWANGKAPDGENWFAVCPLTRDFPHAPSHLYLVTIQHDYQHAMDWDSWVAQPLGGLPRGDCSRYIDRVINPTRELQRSRYMYCLLEAYPTELSGVNDALDEVPDDYYTWLISNSLPHPILLLNQECCSRETTAFPLIL